MDHADMSAMREEVVRFGPGDSLVGILTLPEGLAGSAGGVVLLNAGIVHRVGPNRLYVRLARALAGAGFTVLRFDHSGIGDSPARRDRLSFDKAALAEVQDALALLDGKGCVHYALLGLCSSTLTAFRSAVADPRIATAVLLNALLEDRAGISEDTVADVLARKVTRSYWRDKLFRPQSWLKVLKGKADYRRILRAAVAPITRRFVPPPPPSPAVAAVLAELGSLAGRGASCLFIYSDGTGVREYFRITLEPRLASLEAGDRIEVEIFEGADHNFTPLAAQERVIDRVTRWISLRLQAAVRKT